MLHRCESSEKLAAEKLLQAASDAAAAKLRCEIAHARLDACIWIEMHAYGSRCMRPTHRCEIAKQRLQHVHSEEKSVRDALAELRALLGTKRERAAATSAALDELNSQAETHLPTYLLSSTT